MSGEGEGGVRRSPDDLKPLDEICQPDRRQVSLTVLKGTGTVPYRQKTLGDQFEAVASIVLGSSVPEGVYVRFETAKNLLLYSWFVYRFGPVAELHAIGTLELALKDRMVSSPRIGLKQLLQRAAENGVLAKDGRFDTLVEHLSAIRNELAHGSTMLDASGFKTLRLCAELINALYSV